MYKTQRNVLPPNVVNYGECALRTYRAVNIVTPKLLVILLSLIASACTANEGAAEARLPKISGADSGIDPSGAFNFGIGAPLFHAELYGLNADWWTKNRTLSTRVFELEMDFTNPSAPVFVSGPHKQNREFSTAYLIDTVSARHSNEIYVAGTGRTGESILERWVFPKQAGSYYSEKASAAPLIGTPANVEPLLIGIAEVTETGAGGGGGPFSQPYTHPVNRPSLPPPPIREELYRGTDIGPVASMAIDPEGRFALVTTTDSQELFQVVFSDPVSVTAIFSAANLPILGSDWVRLQVRHHSTEGRKYVLAGSSPDDPAALNTQFINDADNDGVFESVSGIYTYSEYRDSAYGPPSVWSYNYLDYKIVP